MHQLGINLDLINVFNIVPYNLYQMSQKQVRPQVSNYQEFDGLKQHGQSNLKHKDSDHNIVCGKQIASKTCLNPLPHQDLHWHSSKIKRNDLDISFQRGFMDEHQQAHRIQSQNFIESVFRQTGDVKMGLQVFKSYQQGHLSIQYLTQNQKKEFQKDLQSEQKLGKFLKMIQENTIITVSLQLKYLAFKAWNRYLSIQIPSLLSKQKLIQISQNYAKENYQSFLNDSKIKFLNLKTINSSQLKTQSEIKQGFLKFLNYYFTTVFLLIEQYFENPYCQQQQSKRKRQYTLQQYVGEEISSNDVSYLSHLKSYKKFSYDDYQ